MSDTAGIEGRSGRERQCFEFRPWQKCSSIRSVRGSRSLNLKHADAGARARLDHAPTMFRYVGTTCWNSCCQQSSVVNVSAFVHVFLIFRTQLEGRAITSRKIVDSIQFTLLPNSNLIFHLFANPFLPLCIPHICQQSIYPPCLVHFANSSKFVWCEKNNLNWTQYQEGKRWGRGGSPSLYLYVSCHFGRLVVYWFPRSWLRWPSTQTKGWNGHGMILSSMKSLQKSAGLVGNTTRASWKRMTSQEVHNSSLIQY